ncbi:MAG TPA: hypothetical protein VMY37_16290 [Thermoguttaceae bacterium]|nr:hypothetical protein [Thermoguttaceae bacterium]
MNRGQLLIFHEKFSIAARALMSAKNQDYTGQAGTDPFGNLEACEALGICGAQAGILVRMTDKLKRLIEFTNSGQLAVKGESVQDTCRDLVNYAILFAARLEGKGNEDAT